MALFLNGQFVFAQSAQTVAAAKRRAAKSILYTSMETFTADAIKAAFEKKTGLQMEYWRGGSTEVLDRVLSEHRVGKPVFDVVAITGDHMRLMANEGAIGKYRIAVAQSICQGRHRSGARRALPQHHVRRDL